MKIPNFAKNKSTQFSKIVLINVIPFLILTTLVSGIFGQEKPATPTPTVATPPVNAGQATATQTAANSEEDTYVSPMRAGGLTGDYNRAIFLDPDLGKKFLNRKKAWLNDWVRVGAYIRPRWEDRENLSFDKANKGDTSRIMQTSQLFFIIDPSPYFSMKVNIQDARIWGGETPAAVGDTRANTFASTGSTVVPGQASNNTAGQTSIREAWFMVKKLPLNAKVQIGRQIPSYGDQRMIGGANWTINGLSYDGARVMFDQDWFNVHLFGYKLVSNANGVNGVLSANAPITYTDPVTGKSVTNPGQPDQYLVGTYNTVKAKDWFLVDIYSLGVLTHKTPISPAGTLTVPSAAGADLTPNAWNKQQNNLITTGFRISNRTANNNLPAAGPWGGWDWTLESAWQSGATGVRVDNLVAGQDVTLPLTVNGVTYNGSLAGTKNQKYSGEFLVLQTGYTFFEKLRLGVQYQYASGNHNRASASNSTFQTIANPRFGVIPYFNNVSGLSENIDTKNLISKSIHMSYKSNEYGTFFVSYFVNDKAQVQDAWYAINGTANTGFSTEANTGLTNANGQTVYTLGKLGKNIYNEFDIAWMYMMSDYVSLWIGAGFLSAGSAVKNQRNALYTYTVANDGSITLTSTAVLNHINTPSVYGPAGAASQARMFYMQFNAAF
ncbi:alginate export [Leptospira fainei serovar Hurstbridge str. BUT 6]|uniref:Alginate export n=1 Tax=Leptospira fainei serovar Hurstbridge str. BUT 6 TaxID=1193011 RepID=S3V683_9LEPT|nr:alginate export family protein [Leptospira fainei]EPG76169.1 alginate export [Leptospira fainei serovar Hurstbridge str. BUT 6]